MKGAGGSEGGLVRFFMGLVMLVGGGYLFFDSVRVTYGFQMGRALFSVGGMGITSGMVLIPFVFGIGMVFYSSKNIIGWILCGASLVMLVFGVLSSIQFRMQQMSSFSLLMILTLFIGGLGLFLSSFKQFGKDDDRADHRRWRDL